MSQRHLGWLSRTFAGAEPLDSIILRELKVRPIRDAAEQASWNCLMEAHHYLGFRSPFGAALRHVEELSGGE